MSDRLALARRIAATFSSLVALAVLSGCGATSAAAPGSVSGDAAAVGTPCTAVDVLVFAVGVHRNIPAPGLPARYDCVLTKTVAAGHPVAVVAIDGAPTVVLPATTFPITGGNDAAREDDVTVAVGQVAASVHGASARRDGSDVLAGISLAFDVARGALQNRPGTGRSALVVVVDSGLADTGALRLTDPGMMAARSEEVVSYLRSQHALPHGQGMDVELVGFGRGIAPQQPLTQAMTDATVALWSAVLTASGARVVDIATPRQGPGPSTAFTTRTVPVPALAPVPTPQPCRTQVYDDASAVSFLPDLATFRDPSAATRALRPLATWLSASASRRVQVVGTTASAGTAAGRQRLSEQRAAAVAVELEAMGVPADRITTSGAGYTATPPDLRADGTRDPAAAVLNRTVRITPKEGCG